MKSKTLQAGFWASALFLLSVENVYGCDKSSIESALALGVSIDAIMASQDCVAAVVKVKKIPDKKTNAATTSKTGADAAAKSATNSSSKTDSTPSIETVADTAKSKTDTETSNVVATDPSNKAADSTQDNKIFNGSPPNALNGRIHANVNIPGFRLANVPPDNSKNPSLYAPVDSVFLITNDQLESTKGADGKIVENVYGRFKEGVISRTKDKKVTTSDTGDRTIKTRTEAGTDASISLDEEYVVDRKFLSNNENVRQGWTYGLLTAPYKMHLNDRSISSSTTLGPYVGWEVDALGMTGKFVLSMGITTIPVVSLQNGKSQTDNKTAVSVATGALWELNDNFSLGVLLGSDNLGPNSGYHYNGKPWLAIDVGYKFSN